MSRSAFAKLCGVSPSAVTQASRRGKLREASVANRIDADHPAAVAYAAKHTPSSAGGSSETPQRRDRRGRPKAGSRKGPAKPERVGDLAYIDDWGHLTAFELVENHGTVEGMLYWVDALKKVTEIRRLRLQNAEKEGKLISKELVSKHVFGAIDATNRNLLSETPRTIAQRLYAAAKAGTAPEEAERIVRDLISGELSRVVTDAERFLKE